MVAPVASSPLPLLREVASLLLLDLEHAAKALGFQVLLAHFKLLHGGVIELEPLILVGVDYRVGLAVFDEAVVVTSVGLSAVHCHPN